MIDQSFWRQRKILITGHTGFKGSWLASALLQVGASVTGYSLQPPTSQSLYDILNLSTEMNSIISDIRDLDGLKKVFLSVKPDVVFHLAAQPLVRESYINPAFTYETNVMGTVNILECIRLDEFVRSFVNVTTDKVYKNNEWVWGYREKDQLGGIDPYSNSKSCSELVTTSYRDSFFEGGNSTAISTARSGNVIGGGDFAIDRIIPDCVKSIENNENIILRNPNSIRPYQHVLDCISGYLILAQKQYQNKMYEGSYNFGPDESDYVTTSTLVEMFFTEWGTSRQWGSDFQNGMHEAGILKLDCSKAKSVLGWKPRYSVDHSVKKTVEWYRTLYDNQNCRDLTMNQINEYLSL